MVEEEVRKALLGADAPKTVRKRILAVFTGGSVKLEEALTQVEKLIQKGYAVKAVLSQTAVSVVTPNRVRGIPGIGEVVCEPAPSISPIALVRESDAIAVPILTRNSAAKIALGIADTLATNVILYALIMGKPVIAARNSAEPDGANETPPELIQLARDYLQKLSSFGVKLVDAAEIAQSVADYETGVKSGKRLVTQADITGLPDGVRQIKVARGSIITPLAKDAARERGIEIIIGDD